MLTALLSPAIQAFIRTHEQDDEKQLVLKHKEILGVPASFVADQIAGRRKAKEKIPEYYNASDILYPPGLNLEQSSSAQTAFFKAELIRMETRSASVAVDLTGGFGIDVYFLSSVFEKVNYVEPDNALLEIAQHNHGQLGRNNILYHNKTAEEYLDAANEQVDLFYIDPSRRVKGQKVFKLSDCEPDVTALQHQIFKRSEHLLIKTSPLLDIQQAATELQGVKKIFVVAVANEVRELLFLCEKNYTGEPERIATNILAGQIEKFSFTSEEEKAVQISYASPSTYLYEPNAAILKAGGFKTIALKYGLEKIHPSTHFYTHDQLINDFPGRIFAVEARVKSDRKALQSFFPEGKANVITRNYPLSPEELKKKTGLKDGGDKYLIGFSGAKEKFLVAANRIR